MLAKTTNLEEKGPTALVQLCWTRGLPVVVTEFFKTWFRNENAYCGIIPSWIFRIIKRNPVVFEYKRIWNNFLIILGNLRSCIPVYLSDGFILLSEQLLSEHRSRHVESRLLFLFFNLKITSIYILLHVYAFLAGTLLINKIFLLIWLNTLWLKGP